ncbi:zinc finger MYM-type protein 1-like [Xenopus laevis]|uniref:Zinc finger MYM-type protein 1-like n=1 Tax=Xenopus laevis TaxID=8355 RepID=A0A8J1LS23_XENLA|nr:zinc finger MYM-type protein 1-like [Xenopus laevis]
MVQSPLTMDYEETGDYAPVSQSQQSISAIPEITTTSNAIKNIIKSYSNDPAEWGSNISEDLREYFSKNQIQNKYVDYSASKRTYTDITRYLTKELFIRKRNNAECITRDWMIYSPSTGTIFCVPCKLYSSLSHALATSGFNDWKNAAARLREHENSPDHRKCVFIFTDRANPECRIDRALIEQEVHEQKYWREVLRRVVDVVKFLGERGLPFRGTDELFGSPQNGAFLGILELIAKYDPFLEQHIKKYGGESGRGVSNYMSSTIVEEFIELMGNKVAQVIVQELYTAKYFSLIVDSTPDLSHVDQLAIVLRYVNKDGPVERLLGFVPIYSHTGEHLENTVLSFLAVLKINIQDCRGQSYDNASNMSGRYNGLQARIRAINQLAYYVPCSAHSLNLVGTCAAESCLKAATFFNLLECIYVFFSSSTHRWNILKNELCKAPGNLSVKGLSGTRWAARSDATKALRIGFQYVKNALRELESSDHQVRVQHEAKSLLGKLNHFETAILLVVWGNILERLNATSKTLQNTKICLSEVVILYNSLIAYVQIIRDSFDTYELEAKKLTRDHTYAGEGKRLKKRKTFADESPFDDVNQHMSARNKFITETFYVLTDSLIAELKRRNQCYECLNNRFDIFNTNLPISDLRSSADKLQKNYPEDLEDCFTEEFLQFSALIPQESMVCPMAMRQYIIARDLQKTFPNTETLLRMFLCMSVTNASGERSFSCLKRIKNERRTTMGQERLSALSLLAVESALVRQLDFDDIVDSFAKQKVRKVNL